MKYCFHISASKQVISLLLFYKLLKPYIIDMKHNESEKTNKYFICDALISITSSC